MAKKDLVVNIDSKTRGLEQGVSKSVNEVRKLEQQTRKSKNEFKQFDDRVGKLTSGNLKGLLGTMGNVAGVLGVAKLAQEGWMKTMRASQNTSDAFDVAIGQATTSVDYFFTALSTGNFENFFQGITSAIAYSKELTEALDALGDMKIADKFFKAEENYKFEKNRAIITAPDDEYTQEEKEIALAENKAIMDKMSERADAIANKAKEARIAAYKKVTASVEQNKGETADEITIILDEILTELMKDGTLDKEIEQKLIAEGVKKGNHLDTLADIRMKAIFDKVYSGTDEGYLEFEEKIKELEKQISNIGKPKVEGGKQELNKWGIPSYDWDVTSTLYPGLPEDAPPSTKLKNLKKDYPEYNRLYKLKNVIGNEAMEDIARLNDEQWSSLTTIERLRNTQNRLAKRVQGEKGEIKPPEESIAGIDKEISDLNKKISLSVNEEDRRNLYKQIEELQAKKLEIETKYKAEPELPQDSLAVIDKRIQELNKEISLSINDRERRELYKEIEELKKQKIMIEVIYSLPDIEKQSKYATVSNPFEKGLDALNSKKGIVMPNIEKPLSSMQVWNETMNKIREDNWGTIESFNGIAQSMSAIGGATKGTTAEIFQWAATTLSAIGQAIPVIMALTAVKEVEAQANAKAAVTGVASSVAGIPVVGGILAAGAIASVIAAMSSIPKFAEGGIVYGNTIAQVGEYAGASNNPEVIAPLSKLRDILSDTQSNGVGGVVDFRIAGKELVGVINNYSSKQRKK